MKTIGSSLQFVFLISGSKSVSFIHHVGMKNGTTTLGKDLAVSYKTKCTLIL